MKEKCECPFDKFEEIELEEDKDITKSDVFFMQKAYNLAIDAWNCGEVPIGSLIVLNNEIIGFGHNSTEILTNPVAHAEILAIQMACKNLNDWRLTGSTLYVTKEPCPMCAGAIVFSRIKRVVFALTDKKYGCLGGCIKLHKMLYSNHKFQVTPGVLQTECLKLLKTFFQQKRS